MCAVFSERNRVEQSFTQYICIYSSKGKGSISNFIKFDLKRAEKEVIRVLRAVAIVKFVVY